MTMYWEFTLHISSLLHSVFLSGSKTLLCLFRSHSFSMWRKAQTQRSVSNSRTCQEDPCRLLLKNANTDVQHIKAQVITLSGQTSQKAAGEVIDKSWGEKLTYCGCFCKSGCRFLCPAEDSETQWTVQLSTSAQRISLTEWRWNSRQGAGVLNGMEEGKAWRTSEGFPRGTSQKINYRKKFKMSLELTY